MMAYRHYGQVYSFCPYHPSKPVENFKTSILLDVKLKRFGCDMGVYKRERRAGMGMFMKSYFKRAVRNLLIVCLVLFAGSNWCSGKNHSYYFNFDISNTTLFSFYLMFIKHWSNKKQRTYLLIHFNFQHSLIVVMIVGED